MGTHIFKKLYTVHSIISINDLQKESSDSHIFLIQIQLMSVDMNVL